MFDLAHLRCFVAVAEELHFGHAAQRLNMTQPPLSRQIQILERIVDAALLERTSRSVKLTPAGRQFLPEARQILKLAEAATNVARRVSAGKAGSLKFGFTAAAAYGYLPILVSACIDQMPDVDLSLKEMVSNDQTEALLSDHIDFALLRPPLTRREFNSHRVVQEPLLGALPSGHLLASRKHLAISDFDGQPFIMYSALEARYFHDLLIARFAAFSAQPSHVQHLSQIHSILAMVRAGLGLAIVPAAAANLCVSGVVLKPLDAGISNPVELFLVWRKNSDNPLLPRLLQVAKSINQSL